MMTTLEHAIWTAICQEGENRLEDDSQPYTELDKAVVAAEVARRYIEKALDDAYFHALASRNDASKYYPYTKEEFAPKWLKENGIIE